MAAFAAPIRADDRSAGDAFVWQRLLEYGVVDARRPRTRRAAPGVVPGPLGERAGGSGAGRARGPGGQKSDGSRSEPPEYRHSVETTADEPPEANDMLVKTLESASGHSYSNAPMKEVT